MSSLGRESRGAQPRKVEYRHFVAGREVSAEAFLEALRAAGGTATVEVIDLAPAPDGYTLTERGRRALAQEAGK